MKGQKTLRTSLVERLCTRQKPQACNFCPYISTPLSSFHAPQAGPLAISAPASHFSSSNYRRSCIFPAETGCVGVGFLICLSRSLSCSRAAVDLPRLIFDTALVGRHRLGRLQAIQNPLDKRRLSTPHSSQINATLPQEERASAIFRFQLFPLIKIL